MALHASDKPWICGCIDQYVSETGQRVKGFLLLSDKKIISLGLSAGECRMGSSKG